MQLIVNKSDKFITGVFKGKPFTLPFNEDTLKKLNELSSKLESVTVVAELEVLSSQVESTIAPNLGAVLEDINPYLKYKYETNEYFLVFHKGKKEEIVSDIAIPEPMVNFIKESYEKGLDFSPIIEAWAWYLLSEAVEFDAKGNVEMFSKYLLNKYVDVKQVEELIDKGISEEEAKSRSTYQDIAITKNGLLAVYKVAEEVLHKYLLVTDEFGKVIKKMVDRYPSQSSINDVTGEVTTTEGHPEYHEERKFTPAIYKNGEKFFSGDVLGYIYEIGKPQYLPQEATVNRYNTQGGGGLYGGGLSYIANFKRSDTRTLLCFVNPANIISFQEGYADAGVAMRFRELFPYDIMDEEKSKLKSIYHSSDYGKVSKDKISKRIEAATLKTNEEQMKVKENKERLVKLLERL